MASSFGERHPNYFMKRHGNLFGKITSVDNLLLAFQNARRGKGWQNNVKVFEVNLDQNIIKLQQSLIEKTFSTAPYNVKTIYEPKQRQIYILPFYPDRIVQHALMNVLEPIWEKLFIYDSYACIKGKGIHAGSKRTMEFVRKNKYCLKCDISKFYPSINHDILYSIIERKIKCKDTLWLIKNIIYSIDGERNTPIGNYTSQWFGNIYMNELDQYLKHEHKITHYIRYCDDFVLFHSDKQVLKEMKIIIKNYLEEKLKLKMSKCELFPISQGVDFLGYRHFPNYILLRKSTAQRVKKRLKRLPYMLKNNQITHEQFRSSIASTMGWLKWANTYNLQLKLELDKLQEVCRAEKV